MHFSMWTGARETLSNCSDDYPRNFRPTIREQLMRDFIRRFRRAVRTIPRRVRWMLIAPAVFTALFWIDRHLGCTIFVAVLGWLAIRQSCRNQDLIRRADEEASDCRINPATRMRMRGSLDTGGNLYGFDDDERRRHRRRLMREVAGDIDHCIDP